MSAKKINALKLLIVDNEHSISELLRMYFQTKGYEIKTANNGLKAIKIIKQGFLPNLIIADIVMPKMDGFQLCQAIKRDKALANIPFLFLTALSYADYRLHGIMAGADDFMAKPFCFKDLELKVHALVDMRMKKPQAVFCPAMGGIATWLKKNDSQERQCLNKVFCNPDDHAGECALDLLPYKDLSLN